MLNVAIDQYVLVVDPTGLPSAHGEYLSRARLVEQFDLADTDGMHCFVAAGLATDPWPRLVVEQRFSPAGHGFHPGLLLAPDSDTLFIGAGIRLLAYRVTEPSRLWEDSASVGFLRWERHGAIALMLAELEVAAWTVHGEKLWSLPVEPPWSHSVSGSMVTLDVMGAVRQFPLSDGPRAAT